MFTPLRESFLWLKGYQNALVFLKMGGKETRSFSRFLGSKITNLKSESQNSKWPIQYGHLAYNISVTSGFFCCNWLENSYSGVSAVGDDDYEVRLKIKNGGSNMAITCSKFNEFWIFSLRLAWKLLLGDYWDHWRWL